MKNEELGIGFLLHLPLANYDLFLLPTSYFLILTSSFLLFLEMSYA